MKKCQWIVNASAKIFYNDLNIVFRYNLYKKDGFRHKEPKRYG